MKIGIIGSGYMGSTLGHLLTIAGHEVILSNLRGPETLLETVKEMGPLASAGTSEEAIEKCEVIILAANWQSKEAFLTTGLAAGKILIDAVNPAGKEKQTFDLGESTASENTLKRFHGARLVKAFTAIQNKALGEEGRKDLPLEQRRAIFVASDDHEAKQVVSQLIENIGFAPVDTGTLRQGGLRLQNGSPLHSRAFTGAEAQALLATL